MFTALKLEIKCKTEKIAHVISSATNPDNVQLPANMEMRTSVNGNSYSVRMKCAGALMTLRSTIDDLLQNIGLSLSVINCDQKKHI
ncbi:MAG: KEOPS complex subunit Pcc1 [Candidatus Ranarchaeia archaeon]